MCLKRTVVQQKIRDEIEFGFGLYNGTKTMGMFGELQQIKDMLSP